jgi:hypothetical protein
VSRPEPSGPKPPPAVQFLLVRYAKRGKMRFASHRDVARAFERGVRRAGLPVAHSAGFSPHPKISYAGGAPTGVASEAEYLSLAVTVRQEEAAVREKLDAALPDGIDVIDVTEEAGGLPADRPFSDSLCSSLSSIRAISSQAPGRAGEGAPRGSASCSSNRARPASAANAANAAATAHGYCHVPETGGGHGVTTPAPSREPCAKRVTTGGTGHSRPETS